MYYIFITKKKNICAYNKMEDNNFFNLPVLFFTETKKKLCAENYIKKQGFKNVFYVNVPTINKEFNLENAWDFFGLSSPLLDKSFENDFESQQNTIYHLMILKYVIQNNIEKAIILEDDIEFHEDFQKLASIYYKYTPKDFEIIYLGSKNISKVNSPEIILTVPIKGNYAYLITLEGAKKIFHILISQPILKFEDVLYNYMTCDLNERVVPIEWFVWNENIFNQKYPESMLGIVFKK